MPLRDWIASFPLPGAATTATTATEEGKPGELSQLSQQSQGLVGHRATREGGQLSQQSQLSQPLGDSGAHCGESDAGPMRWPFEEWGDLRPCLRCRNLTPMGRCLAAWRGELRAARDYSPTFPDLPQRCIGYRPKADDPVQTPGRERWPELAEWQARLRGDGEHAGRTHG